MSRNMVKNTLQIIYDNRGQGSALRSKDLKQKELPALIPQFLDPLNNLLNLSN